MGKSTNWKHTKLSLETQSKSEQKKELEEIGKQEDKFNKLVDKLRQNARKGKDTK